jgi:hypothetical protein
MAERSSTEQEPLQTPGKFKSKEGHGPGSMLYVHKKEGSRNRKEQSQLVCNKLLFPKVCFQAGTGFHPQIVTSIN